MDPIYNPFSPGAGRRPARLVDRNRQTKLWHAGIHRGQQGSSAQPMALHGLRGVGKTVLLGEFTRLARQADWVVAKLQASSRVPLRESLAESLHGALAARAVHDPSPAMKTALGTALSFISPSAESSRRWAFQTDLTGHPGSDADSGRDGHDLTLLARDLVTALADQRQGAALLIDEAHELSLAELGALAHVAHQAVQEEWPLLLALAGLPNLPGRLARSQPYAERLFAIEPLQALTCAQSRQLLIDTAAEAGAEFTAPALDHLVEAGLGNPYFLQQLGQETWNAAAESRVSLADARAGTERGLAMLDRGFFLVRWERASPTEQKYLRMMAEDGEDGSSTTKVAGKLGKSTKAIGTIRARLIEKGLIYTPSYGRVSFTVPGMAGFISRQPGR